LRQAAGIRRRPHSPVEAGFQQFWDAKNPQEARAAAGGRVARLLRGGLRALEERPLVAPRHAAWSALTRKAAAGDFPYTIDVPQNYDPSNS
jgi:hypothetical protein